MPSQIDEVIAKMRGLSQKATEEMRFYSARLSGAEEILAVLAASQHGAHLDGNSIASARGAYRKAFAQDPDFRRGYVDNIAMLLHDHFGITDYEVRNRAGDAIVKLIFEFE